MTSLVVDSWAWVEYLSGSESGKKVDGAIQEAQEIWVSLASVAEVVSKYRRKGRDDALALRAITTLSKVGIQSLEDAQEAGRIHAELKRKVPNFSLADSFVLQLARKLDATVLTGDPDFRGLKDAEVIE